MTFFTDRDLGSRFPQILSDAGLQVEKHDDHFPERKTPDASWLSEVGRNGWFALSRDKRIRYRPNEQEASMRAGVGLFVIVGQASHQKLAEHFVACLPKITRFLRKHHPLFIAKIYMPSPSQKHQNRPKTGRVEMWLSHQEWSNRTT